MAASIIPSAGSTTWRPRRLCTSPWVGRLRPSRMSLRRLRERARRLHEHGGDDERLRLYAERWWVWIHAGLGEGRASMASRKGGLKRHRREVLRYLQYRRTGDGGRGSG